MIKYPPYATKPNEPEIDRAPAIPNAAADMLFRSRTITVFGEINDQLARQTVAQLLALDSESSAPIRLILCSPGGHVESGDSIHDAIRFIRSPVIMIGTGWVASAGALIYLAAYRSRRYCLKNTRFLLHQPLGGASGSGSDIEIHTREIVKTRRRLNSIIARETGQTLERVEKDTDRDYWLTAEEAQQYGIVTHIVERSEDVRLPPDADE